MKKFIVVLLVLVMILMMSACAKPHEHEWQSWTQERAATVLTDGSEYRKCDCGEREYQIIPQIGIENVLNGEWLAEERSTNPIRPFLIFYSADSGKMVRYGWAMNGNIINSSIKDCTYTVVGDIFTATTKDGWEYVFEIQDEGNTIRLFDENGLEYFQLED